MKNKMFSCSKTTNYFCIILVIIPRAIYRLAVKAIAQLVATADLRRLVNARSIALFLRKKIPQSYNPIDYYSKKKLLFKLFVNSRLVDVTYLTQPSLGNAAVYEFFFFIYGYAIPADMTHCSGGLQTELVALETRFPLAHYTCKSFYQSKRPDL